MIVRTAYWSGDLPKENRDAFFAGIQALKPKLQILPGVRDVRLKRPYEAESGPCYHFAELSVVFDDRAGLEAMLASEGRQAVRADFAQLAPLFTGSIHHINFEVS